MKRKDLKHIQIKSVENTPDEIKTIDGFQTAEGIALKPTYTEEDIQQLEHLDFGAGFAGSHHRSSRIPLLQHRNRNLHLDSHEQKAEGTPRQSPTH